MGNDLFTILKDFTTAITDFAASKGIQSWLIFGAGILISILIGLFAVRIVKLLLALMMGYVGYAVGVAVFTFFAKDQANAEWMAYAAGAVAAIIFFALAYAKFSYAYFTLAAYIGYIVGLYYFDNNTVIAIGAGLLIGFIAAVFARVFFVLLTSLTSGAIVASFLAALLPNAEWLEVSAKSTGFLAVALGVSAVFAVVQFISSRRAY